MTREATAYHEAGHAVATWHHHFKLRSVSIEPNADSSGRLIHDNPLRGIRLDIEDTPRARIRAENAIIVCLAGPVAQRRYNARSFRLWHAEADHHQAADLALRICGSGTSATAFLKWLNVRTKELIEVRWQNIERVTAGLLEKATLQSEEILALIYPQQRGPGVVRILPDEDSIAETDL